MWHWLKRKSKVCSQDDVRFLLLLCVGSDAHTAAEYEKRRDKSVFSVCKALLASHRFSHLLPDPLKLNQTPYLSRFEAEQLKILTAGLQKHFGVQNAQLDPGATHKDVLLTAMQSPRFLRAFEAEHPACDIKWFKDRLTQTEIPSASLKGEIDDVSENQITGYAFDAADPEKPLTLKVFVNGSFVGNCKTGIDRRDAQEVYNIDTPCGFEHALTIPEHISGLHVYAVHIYDAESGLAICPPHIFSPITARGSHYIERLVSEVHTLRKAFQVAPENTAKELEQKLEKIQEYLPDINRYAAFPLELYETYRSIHKDAEPPAITDNAPTISVVSSAIQALAATTDLILVSPEGTDLHKNAEKWFQHAAANNPDAAIFFSDFSARNTEGITTPHLRASFDPDMLLQAPSYATAFAIRRDMLEELGELRQNMKTAIWYDLWLRVLAARGSNGFLHIDAILFHIPTIGAIDAGHAQHALKSYFDSQVISATSAEHNDRYGSSIPNHLSLNWPIDPEMPKLAIIIPTRDQLPLIQECLTSLRHTLEHPYHTEILIIDNGSQEEETRRWLRTADNMDGVRVIVEDSPFNWSALNNRAVKETDADYLLFLNNDTAALDKGWDTVLRGQLHRPDVGCVGARLLFHDGSIQYAGYILDEQNIVLKEGYAGTVDGGGYQNRTKLTHASSAIIGAFLACRRDTFEQAGGFNTDLAVAYNDIDYSLTVSATGLRNIYCPDITFHHFESKSRGYDHMDPQKQERVHEEATYLRKKWRHLLVTDKWYPTAFLKTEPTHRLLAAPVSDYKTIDLADAID